MNRRVEVQEAVRAMADSLGATVVFELPRNGGHIKAVLTYGGRSRFIFLSGTPSDGRAYKVAAHDARRVLRGMGAAL
jgi:hypothetical protein